MTYGIIIKGKVEPQFVVANSPSEALKEYISKTKEGKNKVIEIEKVAIKNAHFCVILLDGTKETKTFYKVSLFDKEGYVPKNNNVSHKMTRKFYIPEPNEVKLKSNLITERLDAYSFTTTSDKYNPVEIKVNGRTMSLFFKDIYAPTIKGLLNKFARDNELVVETIQVNELGKYRGEYTEFRLLIKSDSVFKERPNATVCWYDSIVESIITEGYTYIEKSFSSNIRFNCEPTQDIVINLNKNKGLILQRYKGKTNRTDIVQSILSDKPVDVLNIKLPDKFVVEKNGRIKYIRDSKITLHKLDYTDSKYKDMILLDLCDASGSFMYDATFQVTQSKNK